MKDECQGCDKMDCQDCCPHDETDHGECIDCGADRMDYLIMKAEYQSEGDR
jgi:hypothetical protein